MSPCRIYPSPGGAVEISLHRQVRLLNGWLLVITKLVKLLHFRDRKTALKSYSVRKYGQQNRCYGRIVYGIIFFYGNDVAECR